MIEVYFDKIENTILFFKVKIKFYSITKKAYNEKQGFIKGEIHFINDSRFYFIEVKDVELRTKDKYSYHYVDKDNTLIFRYDNADHHKEITTFPHHKHLPNNKLIESVEPELFDVLIETQKKSRGK
ncbi:MAG: hypothetical protein FVQ77_06725 [Cytophagales bacterium]|nr:hypothetical protein [Cytophagales bacterium]